MKTKGITVVERFIEKGILGLAAVFAVAFAAMQLLSEAPATQAAGGEVNPGTVDARLEEQTRRLKAAIEVEGLPAGVEVLEASGEVGPSFTELVETPTVGFRKVQVTEAAVDLGGVGGITLTAGAYNVPTLPGPPAVFVETHFDAISIDKLELSGDDELILESRLGVTGSPGDIVWNTVGFQIPWDEMDAAMRDAPGGDRDMPEAWYSGRIDVLDIVVERQKRIDGEWAPAVVLKTMPARWSLRENLIEERLSRKDRDAIVESLWLDRDQDRTPSPILQDILRPEFYATASDRWSAPLAPSAEEDNASKGDNWREIAKWKRKLREAQKKANRRAASIEGLGGTPGEADEPDRKDQKPGQGSGASGIGGGDRNSGSGGGSGRRESSGKRAAPGAGLSSGSGGFGAGTGTPEDPEKKKRQLAGLQKQYQDALKDVSKAQDRLRALGYDPSQAGAVELSGLANDLAVAWFHDLEVEPGAEYRYRVRFEVLNPFFARQLDLQEAQINLAKSMVMPTESSSWTDTVAVPGFSQFFITGGEVGASKMQAEVFCFKEGRWWSHMYNRLQLGARIGDSQRKQNGDERVEIDFGTDWMPVDLEIDYSMEDDDIEAGQAAIVRLQHVSDHARPLLSRKVWLDGTSLSRDQFSQWVDEANALAEPESEDDEQNAPQAPPSGGGGGGIGFGGSSGSSGGGRGDR
ncbi:MAG TPA: hypothetical protein DEQ73_05095 [Phycisphaerales bacterium]|nr:hypothetical protein [Phycisphaerales bacterium]